MFEEDERCTNTSKIFEGKKMHFGRPRFFAFSIQVVKNMILKKLPLYWKQKNVFFITSLLDMQF